MVPQDSAKFWFPRLTESPFTTEWTPKTHFVDYDEGLLAPSLLCKPTAEYDRLYYEVEAVIKRRFEGGPVFIRTDITSAKHAGVRAFKVQTPDELNTSLLITLTHAHLKSYHQKVKSSAIMIRPYLELKHTRTAFGGLPVAKEWRVFADQRGVQCVHAYWPDEALRGHMDDGGEPNTINSSNWHEGWYNTEIADTAKWAAKNMREGKWSVDFAEDVNGKLWLLDMATAPNSYHDPACKFFGLDNWERI